MKELSCFIREDAVNHILGELESSIKNIDLGSMSRGDECAQIDKDAHELMQLDEKNTTRPSQCL